MISWRRLSLRLIVWIALLLLAFYVATILEPFAHSPLARFGVFFSHIVVMSILSVMIFFGSIVRLRDQLLLLMSFHDQLHARLGSARVTSVVLDLLHPALETELSRLVRLTDGGGLRLDRHALAQVTQRAFRRCRGIYIGTDKNPPSTFRGLYPQYLEDQVSRNRGRLAQDVRFLIVDPAALVQDYASDQFEFTRFYDMHWKHQVELLQVDPSQVEIALTKAGLPSAEIGLYGWRYVIFFSPTEERTGVTVYAARLQGPLAVQCRQFLEELVSYAKVVRLRSSQRPTLVTPDEEYRAHLRNMLAIPL